MINLTKPAKDSRTQAQKELELKESQEEFNILKDFPVPADMPELGSRDYKRTVFKARFLLECAKCDNDFCDDSYHDCSARSMVGVDLENTQSQEMNFITFFKQTYNCPDCNSRLRLKDANLRYYNYNY